MGGLGGGGGGGGCGGGVGGVGGGARFPGSARSSPALIAHHPDSSSDSQIRPSKRCDWPPPPPPPPPAAPTAARIAPRTSRIWLSSNRTRSSGSQSQSCQRVLVVLGGSASSPSTSTVESHLMREPIKMQSACTQNARCRHSAGTLQAPCRHSAGTLQALCMQSVEPRIAPAQQDALARTERRLERTTLRAPALIRSPSRVPSGLVRVGA